MLLKHIKQDSINEKIETLKQSNAAEVQNISDAAYNKYLKLLKVDKDIKKFEKIDAEHTKLQAKLVQVYESVKSSWNRLLLRNKR